MRASAACEKAGVPTASLMSEGFIRQGNSIAAGLGLRDMPVCLVPGHPGVQTPGELRANVLAVTARQVIDGLVRQPEAKVDATPDFSPDDVVFRGSFEAVNAHFLANGWTDGLPIVPPTREKVAAFLRFTDRAPNAVLGIVPAENRAATVWNVAVNGVMAGCRPEYMPVLVAMAEAMADPEYGVQHSGNTPAPETLVILNGPIARQLGFNFEQGVLRDGFQANTSVGRFWRLYLRNVAAFRLHQNDKGCFGGTWRVVMPENHDVVRRIGWTTVAEDMHLRHDANAVTIARYSGGDVIPDCNGTDPELMLSHIAESLTKLNRWHLVMTLGYHDGMLRPLLVFSPILVEALAKAGWDKARVRRWLFDHARVPASLYQYYIDYMKPRGDLDIRDEVRAGRAPKIFYESDDPHRLVPIVREPDHFMIAVSGDPLRNHAYTFMHNGTFGFPVSRGITLPADWDALLKEAGASS